MDSKKVFKIAWLYRKKFLWKKTLEDLFNWEPLDALEKIEFFLEAIRLVNTLWFEKVWNLKQFENINKNEVRNTAFTFLKNEKIVGNNVYALAAKYLLEAWWENVFENIEEDQLHSYYKLEITVDDLYKSNKEAFDFVWASGRWYTYANVNSIYTVKWETVTDIWWAIEYDTEEEEQFVKSIEELKDLKNQRYARCAFIIYMYYKNKWEEDLEKYKAKVIEKITITVE